MPSLSLWAWAKRSACWVSLPLAGTMMRRLMLSRAWRFWLGMTPMFSGVGKTALVLTAM